MLRRSDRVLRQARHGLAMLLVMSALGPGFASAQQPGGGLGPTTGLTRAELTRSWDLDGNGTISKPEADVARARMKRERVELQLGGGVDPVTGLPRNLEDEPEVEHTPGDEPEFRLPAEESLPLPSSRGLGSSLPGSRAPSMAPPRISAPIPSTGLGNVPSPTAPRIDPSRPTDRSPGAAGSPTRPTGASWLSPNARGSALTGGVRAGAPAAVPGYGSGPWSNLNAARNRYTPAPVTMPRTGAAGLGASGLGTSPQRTGSILLPGGGTSLQPGLGSPMSRPMSPLPSMTQPMVPPPPVIQRPRISAEEMGGY
jgi:hypothetical protein